MQAKTASQSYIMGEEADRSDMLIHKRKYMDSFLYRAARFLTGIGVILLLIQMLVSALAQISEGGPFAASSHFSGTDGYRFFAVVGFTIACGLVYKLNKVGRALSLVVAVIVMWQIYLWFSVYRSIDFSLGLPQILEIGTMLIVFIAIVWFASYTAYQLAKERRIRGVSHPAT